MILSDELLIALKNSILAINLAQVAKFIKLISQENRQLAKIINQHIKNFEDEDILQALAK